MLIENTENVIFKVEALWLKEKNISEKIFTSQYQHITTEIKKIYLNEVVKPLKGKVCNPDDGISWMIINDRKEALRTMYKVFKMLDDYFEVVSQEFRKLVIQEVTTYLNVNSADIKSKNSKKVIFFLFIKNFKKKIDG